MRSWMFFRSYQHAKRNVQDHIGRRTRTEKELRKGKIKEGTRRKR